MLYWKIKSQNEAFEAFKASAEYFKLRLHSLQRHRRRFGARWNRQQNRDNSSTYMYKSIQSSLEQETKTKQAKERISTPAETSLRQVSLAVVKKVLFLLFKYKNNFVYMIKKMN